MHIVSFLLHNFILCPYLFQVAVHCFVLQKVVRRIAIRKTSWNNYLYFASTVGEDRRSAPHGDCSTIRDNSFARMFWDLWSLYHNVTSRDSEIFHQLNILPCGKNVLELLWSLANMETVYMKGSIAVNFLYAFDKHNFVQIWTLFLMTKLHQLGSKMGFWIKQIGPR